MPDAPSTFTRPAETIRTARLRLRRFTPDDIDTALAIHANPDLARFVPSAVLSTADEAADWLRRVSVNDGPGRGWWCVEAASTPVAAILLKPIPASTGVQIEDVEIGWRAAAHHTGCGYVTEAARAVLDEALAGGLRRVIAVTDPGNVASQRVAERIGMRHVGRTCEYYDEELDLFVASGVSG